MKTIALALSHPPDHPEQLARLERELGFAGDEWDVPGGPLMVKRFPAPEMYGPRSRKKWHWFDDSGAEYGLHLRHSARVSPNFWQALRALLASGEVDGRVDGRARLVSLEGAHAAAQLFHVGGDPWFTARDLVSSAHIAGVRFFREFREWCATELLPSAIYALTEEQLLAVFCMVTGTGRVHCPTRSFVDHDPVLEARPRPPVTWETSNVSLGFLEHAECWTPKRRVPHVGRVDARALVALRAHVKPIAEDHFARLVADDGAREIVRAKAETRLVLGERLGEDAVPTVVVGTPTHGVPNEHYMSTVWNVIRRSAVEIVEPFEQRDWWMWRDDNVRTRSRMAAMFLKSGRSHLWFLDDDVSCDPIVLEGMLAAKRDFVMCPYPVKKIHWSEAEKDDGRSLEARAMKFDNVQPLVGAEHQMVDSTHCLEIRGGGLGCALISRAGLQRLVDFCSPTPEQVHADLTELAERYLEDGLPRQGLSRSVVELVDLLERVRENAIQNPPITYEDPIAGTSVFPFAMKPYDIKGADGTVRRHLLSEDLSFCERWRRSGQQVWMYVGPGAPATHHGMYAFRGLPESLQAPPGKKDAEAAE